MTQAVDKVDGPGGNKNTRLAIILLSIVIGMVGLAFASVPLYRIFCQVTGFAGTPKVASNSYDVPILDREVTIDFNADVAPGVPWRFEPVQRRVKIRIGEEALIYYRAVNDSDKPVTGTAIFNVTPEKAAPYFNKIACFCFTKQTLQPHESVEMPVTFFIDPAIADDLNVKEVEEITLSYTFFKAKE
ncbi:cytochrome c oxidase assembly protein [Govanella unica]|uniref:Cytochrome c oxidase assembly protein CtaG n=1 Tax=Govanella unica TaxID=2975056 RepID=A0A9X3Z6P7_9PROT|nr:cytochrome c oxidase assembly protein [Govania unica]MDA5193351.1 cytochrome c oxidase assembly protein [Govania unica]